MPRRTRGGLALVALCVALAGCASLTSTSSSPSASSPSAQTPRGPSTIPSAALSLGDYRGGSANSVSRAFAETVSQRYGAGVGLSAIVADLRRQQFACTGGGATRGDPPDQVCRRRVSAGSCQHTWQVLLYNDPGERGLSRSRGLYDRSCGDGELLGR